MKSTYPDVHVPGVTLHEIFLETADLHKDRIALVNGITHESFTFGDLKNIVLRVASALHARGLKKGDTLALFLTNCPEFAILLMSAMCLGVRVTLVNPRYSKYELCNQLKDSGSSYIFTSEDLANRAEGAAVEARAIKEIFVVGEAAGCTSFKTLTEYNGPSYDVTKINFKPAEDVAFLPYSSGTTGLPKGVMLTHTNMVCNLYLSYSGSFDESRDGPQETLLGILPFCHISGLKDFIIHLSHGGKIVTIPRFQPRQFLYLIEKYKVTVVTLVPALVLFLLQSPLVTHYDLSTVKSLPCGGATLGSVQEEQISKTLAPIIQGYGLTETSSRCTANPPEKIKIGSIGVAAPNTETQIVDTATGKVLGPNKVGELWTRGPQIMKGYLNRRKETRETLDEKGWLHTGDLAYYDEDKYFYIVDRIKELIKCKGYQVAPAELEALLLTHPDIDDVAVTGIPDQEAGEVPCAFVIKTKGSSLSGEDVKRFVSDKVAPYKQIRGGVHFVEEIPRNNSGKPLRRVLKDLAFKGLKFSKL